MDDHCLDALARMLATGAGRRQMLRLLAGGVAGATLLRRALAAPAAAAQEIPLPQIACTQDSDCIRADGDPCVGASCIGGACAVFTVDCVEGSFCCGNGQCCPGSGSVSGSDACVSDADCAGGADSCTGARCESGVCTPFSVMCAPGF